MTLTLGIQTGHESSAALMEGTRIVAAVSDERLSRVKNDGGRLGDLAIDEVLRLAGKARSDVERLALLYTFFPEDYFIRETWIKELERRLSRLRKGVRAPGSDRPQMLLSNFIERLEARGKRFESHFRRERFLLGERFNGATPGFYDHHLTHAVAAAYYSGYRDCAVVTMDGVGDRHISHTSGVWHNGRYQRRHVTNSVGASPGTFYGHITELLGFRVMRHEGKVVGLAAMGDASPLYEAFRRALRPSPDGCRLDSEFVGRPQAEGHRHAFLKHAIKGHSRENVSAACQRVLEDAVLEMVRKFLADTGQRRIALNGGVFANVKLNQRIAALPEVDGIFVFPAMSDTGNSVGAVLLDLAARDPDALAGGEPLRDVYWGPSYSDTEIEAALAAAGVRAVRLAESRLIENAARAIHDGRIVGWFQGRMEFGPRALGNRSMLARPTEGRINDWLNQRLERSEFMPFAPSVLAERADEIFIGVDKARHTAEFMTITFDVRPEWRGRVPAVVHVDGTARPQLVRSEINPLFHRLISAYHALSGNPLVLNTSFNVHEEPIVCAPPEAVRALVDRRIDDLAIGPYWAAGARAT
jgi:carbamoyltransferase